MKVIIMFISLISATSAFNCYAESRSPCYYGYNIESKLVFAPLTVIGKIVRIQNSLISYKVLKLVNGYSEKRLTKIITLKPNNCTSLISDDVDDLKFNRKYLLFLDKDGKEYFAKNERLNKRLKKLIIKMRKQCCKYLFSFYFLENKLPLFDIAYYT